MTDAQLMQDIEAVRASLIAQKYLFLCESTSRPKEIAFWDDMFALMGGVPPGVLVVRTRMDDVDDAPAPNSDPNLTQRRPPSADSPKRNDGEQRTADPLPEPEPPDPRTLARVMTMARRRKLKAYHTGRDIALTDASGETLFSGSVAEVYEALKQDTLAHLPTPADQLRSRLAQSPWDWTLTDDANGMYTLCRRGERMFTGDIDTVTSIAASRILNTLPNFGHPE